jgi:cytochrome P450
MDDPRHRRLRNIVSRGFTNRALQELKSDVEAVAAEAVGDIAERGECDFVTEVAAPIPTRVILNLMGVPRSQESFVFNNTNRILGAFDTEYIPDQSPQGRLKARLGAVDDLTQMATELAQDRIKHPKADLVTKLVVDGVEGENLTPGEMSAFFILLLLAGNETTRNAISHGMLALSEHPDQRALWQADFDGLAPTAVEEVVRWATPVLHMRRTVTAGGARVGDVVLEEGDRVVMWYYSANRDPAAIDDPLRFDLIRQPVLHFSFGAPGPHFCLGAHLARREITVAFRELFRQTPDLTVSGPPEWLGSNFINGIKHLPVVYTPARRKSA